MRLIFLIIIFLKETTKKIQFFFLAGGVGHGWWLCPVFFIAVCRLL